MATMAYRLDGDAPGDVAGLVDIAPLSAPVDPCVILLEMLIAARKQSYKIAGHNTTWVLDVQNALNDLIEGVECEVMF